MSPAAIGGLGAAALFVLLFLRVPVWAALTVVGVARQCRALGLDQHLGGGGADAVRFRLDL